jgi:hypothetical protein
MSRERLSIVHFGGVVGMLIVGLFLVVAAKRVFSRRGRSNLGPAAVGSVYDMLSEDKRKAVQIVIEERAGARDPEDADGNLPDLARRGGFGPR